MSEHIQVIPSVWHEPEIINGFLWMGDVHLGTRRPERRFNDYNDRILAKVERAVEIANDKRLLLLLAGDLFHHAREEDDALKTQIQDLFARLWLEALLNIGNHDKKGLMLSKKDSLSVIASSRLVRMAHTMGPVAVYTLSSGRRVMIGASPYDTPIPQDIRGMEGDVDRIWMTHHDLALGGSYPGSSEVFEMKGCKFVMNGHMHLHREPTQLGESLWCNFGSIARTAIDAMDETPSVWEINEQTFQTNHFEQHVLPHQPGPVAFDMTGRLVEALPAAAGLAELKPSTFIQILKGDMQEAQETVHQNGMYLEDLEGALNRANAKPELRTAIMNLRSQVLKDDNQDEDVPPEETPATPPPRGKTPRNRFSTMGMG